MTTPPLQQLKALGQRIWLDDIRRDWLDDGTLAWMIDDDGVAGVTSNPSIFEKAIAHGSTYDAAIERLARGADARAICEALMLEDVGRAADLFRPQFDTSGGADGFVSHEVSPLLANDADATVAEARRLWSKLARPNVMIKVPGTCAGLAAIRELIAAGVNVNVTLLFGVDRYREVLDAFTTGLAQRAAAGAPLAGIASVASFFLSRIDTLVDRRLDAIGTPAAAALRGQAAIASARLAYAHWRDAWLPSARWQALARAGAHPQRLLWASTSTKDKVYSPIKYVEALIGPDTINTLPLETIAVYHVHGAPQVRIGEEIDAARALPHRLAELGIDLASVADELERDGVRKFADAYEALLRAIEQRMRGT